MGSIVWRMRRLGDETSRAVAELAAAMQLKRWLFEVKR